VTANSPRPRGSGSLRIVGGVWRRRRLAVADLPGLRPTPDRVRETVFNWLGQQLDGLRVLDLFAGSGALGLEAASRGAAEVVLVERDARAAALLRTHVAALDASASVRVIQDDALHFLGTLPRPFDVLFLDPPYALDLTAVCLARLPDWLASGALVYTEHDTPLRAPDGWEIWRSGRAGRVHFGLLRWNPRASASSTPEPLTR